jgi:hypothetical protein
MSVYIGQESGTPVLLDELRNIATNISFPDAELTTASDWADALTGVSYEVVTITNAETDVTPAWNQKVELGLSSRVGGNLQASWAAVAMTTAEAAAALEAIKQEAEDTTQTEQDLIARDSKSFAKSSATGAAVITLNYDNQTLGYITQLLQVAQNANASNVTLQDSAGTDQTLTLNELKYICASMVETAQDLIEDVETCLLGIEAATTGTAVTTTRTTFTTSNPPPSTS